MTQKIACITLDMEPDYGDPKGEIRLLQNREFFERYVATIRKYKAKVTMFTVTALFERYQVDFKSLNESIPLEYAVHSHSHDSYSACSYDEVEKSVRAFKSFTDSRPIGYRAPTGQINKAGLGYLMDFGFEYDASVYTSIRPGKLGYWNLHMPNSPFRIVNGDKSLIELPFTSVDGIRIPFALSYVKLLGWVIYSTLLKAFGLPGIVLALTHPHDFYYHLVPNPSKGLEKLALSRNGQRGFEYFDKMLHFLQDHGYEFLFVSEAYEQVKENADLKEIPLDSWK